MVGVGICVARVLAGRDAFGDGSPGAGGGLRESRHERDLEIITRAAQRIGFANARMIVEPPAFGDQQRRSSVAGKEIVFAARMCVPRSLVFGQSQRTPT